MNKLLIRGLWFGLATTLVLSPQSAPTEQKILSIVPISQKGGLWCWAASAEMILVYLQRDRSDVSQCVQVSDRHGIECCADSASTLCDDQTAPPRPQGCDVEGGWPDFLRYGFNCETNENETPLPFGTLREQFKKNKPVAFSWHWEDSGGHMLVAAGYKVVGGRRYVWVIDPALPCKNGGNAGWKPYSFYDHGGSYYWHWRDFYEFTAVNPGL